MLWSPDAYTLALNFASQAHQGQCVPGTKEPYLRHVATVAGEVMAALARRTDLLDGDLAVQCALLHDVVEDTPTGLDELARCFGPAVAAGVSALTKDPTLPDKRARMQDSLDRIRRQPFEIWMVKLADRITNLQPPPAHWSRDKIAAYGMEATLIHDALASACDWLAARLASHIERYPPPMASPDASSHRAFLGGSE